jgi:hypothetical protein
VVSSAHELHALPIAHDLNAETAAWCSLQEGPVSFTVQGEQRYNPLGTPT